MIGILFFLLLATTESSALCSIFGVRAYCTDICDYPFKYAEQNIQQIEMTTSDDYEVPTIDLDCLRYFPSVIVSMLQYSISINESINQSMIIDHDNTPI